MKIRMQFCHYNLEPILMQTMQVKKIKYVNEAYIGLNLDKANKHSIEVGILPCYIGFETATSASNLTFIRSLLAENSPYFMTGIKYSYKPSDKWSFAALVNNMISFSFN